MSEQGDPTQQAAPDSGTGQQGVESASQAPDPLAGRFDEFRAETLGSIQDGFSGLREALQPPQEPQPPYADLLEEYGIGQQDPGQYQDPNGGFQDPSEFQDPGMFQDPQQAMGFLTGLAERAVEAKYGEKITGLESRLEAQQIRERANQIVNKYPDMGTQEVLDKVFPAAQQRAEMIGNPDLAYNPDFMLQEYLAGLAQAQAQQQNPAGQPDDIRLDGNHGGGGPAQQLSADDEGDQIVAAAQRRNVLFGQ